MFREEARERRQKLVGDEMFFHFHVGPIRLSLPLPWKKSTTHLLANFIGCYTFLTQTLRSVSTLENVDVLIKRKIDQLDLATFRNLESKMAEEPRLFGVFSSEFRCPALPMIQQLLIQAHAFPPVIENSLVGTTMMMQEGTVRQAKGYRYLEWPYYVLNGLNLKRFNESTKLRLSDLSDTESDTDENGSDGSDDDEQGADANIVISSHESGNITQTDFSRI